MSILTECANIATYAVMPKIALQQKHIIWYPIYYRSGCRGLYRQGDECYGSIVVVYSLQVRPENHN
jgi:23S rRNA A2030 N6-methylase RlmJ